MPVTELALLQCKSPSSTTPSPLLPRTTLHHLTRAAREQASFSGHPVALLQCHEDPALVYLIGGWQTVEQHMHEWIPSQTNQALLEALSTDLDVKWMFHLDMDPTDVIGRLMKGAQSRSEEGNEGVVAIGRHFIRDGQRDKFFATWEANGDTLEDFLGERSKREGGWRVDWGFIADAANDSQGDGVPDEFVIFTAWDIMGRHMDFAKTERFQSYSKTGDQVEKAEIRHGRVFCITEP